MNIPSFTAEASLYKTSVHYYSAAILNGGTGTQGVWPAQACDPFSSDYVECLCRFQGGSFCPPGAFPGECCFGGSICCGGRCCPTGLNCADEERGLCCARGLSPCGGICCAIGQYCADPGHNVCCSSNEVLI